jgi:hypothetical protein
MEEPTREDIEERWKAIIEGRVSREDVHAWAVPWVERTWRFKDPMVSVGATYLHGYDLTFDPAVGEGVVRHAMSEGWAYLKPIEEIRSDLEHWQRDSIFFDRDPDAWRKHRLALFQEESRRGPPRKRRPGPSTGTP